MSSGTGQAGAVECVATVPVSGGFAGSKADDAECSDYKCAKRSSGSEERVATVSVSGRTAGWVFVFLVFKFVFGRCEAGGTGWFAGCREFGLEQFEFEL